MARLAAALLLVGAATLPELFDAIKMQYRLALNFFHLEDAGMLLVRGVKDIGDIQATDALEQAVISNFVPAIFRKVKSPLCSEVKSD